MLGIFVKDIWSSFYIKGMKTWEIRPYTTNYRGPVVLINSKNNLCLCIMQLVDCIPLSKERWEMNYEKHRTLSSYETLSYKTESSPGYAWVLKNPYFINDNIRIERRDRRPIIEVNEQMIPSNILSPITFTSERIACKFVGSTMFLYWLRKNYFSLIALIDLNNNDTSLITSEIAPSEKDYIVQQLIP